MCPFLHQVVWGRNRYRCWVLYHNWYLGCLWLYATYTGPEGKYGLHVQSLLLSLFPCLKGNIGLKGYFTHIKGNNSKHFRKFCFAFKLYLSWEKTKIMFQLVLFALTCACMWTQIVCTLVCRWTQIDLTCACMYIQIDLTCACMWAQIALSWGYRDSVCSFLSLQGKPKREMQS